MVVPIIPNMIVNPSPLQNLSRSDIGSVPRTVVRVVRRTGSSRDEPASTRAFIPHIHFLIFSLIADISTTPWFTHIPVNATNHIPNGRENGLSVIKRPIITNGRAITTE
jgi:hypothetical protein